MIKKLTFRKRLCCLIAVLSFFLVSGNSLFAGNKQSGQVAALDFTLGAMGGLEGAWIIDQVQVKKTVNGVSSETTYSLKLKQKIESFKDCPTQITFTADGKVIFDYNDKDSSENNYTVKGNRIAVLTPAAMYAYEYTIMDATKIQLLYSVNYVHNSGDDLDHITEEYTFFGTKK